MSSPLRSVVSSGDSAAHRHKPILADRFKTKLCRTFGDTGSCPYEERCMFAHGDEDLRTKEMNLESKLTTEDAIRQFQRARAIAKGLIEDGDSSSAAGLTPMPMTPQSEAPKALAEEPVMLGAPRVSASAAMGQRFVAALRRPTALDVAALSERAVSPSTAKTPATTVAFGEEVPQQQTVATPASQPETVACIESPATRASAEPSPALTKRTPTRVYRHNPYAPVTLGWAVPPPMQLQQVPCISAAAVVAPMPTYAARIYAAAAPRCSAAPLPPMPPAPARRAAPAAVSPVPMSTYGPMTTYCAAAPVQHEVLLA